MAGLDLIVVGGGIVGMATSMAILERFPHLRLLILEKEDQLASHQTGHNSGVIHSGLYYKPGSAKARLCVSGAAEMVRFCQRHGVPHEICGKVIVATSPAELPALEELYRRAQANVVPGVERIRPDQLKEIEPHAAGVAALKVPGTGIVSYAQVVQQIARIVTSTGGEIRTSATLTGIAVTANSVVAETAQGEFKSRHLINCAGLHSDRIARMVGADPGIQVVPFRGEYYELAPTAAGLVRTLIYPVPDGRFPFLGVHFTKKIHGGVEAGPNAVLALKREGYSKSGFNLRDASETLVFPGFWRMAGRYWRTGAAEYYRSLSKAAFARALQKLVPEIREKDLRPGGAGVRAQALDRMGRLVDDFQFLRHGRTIHVLNVPSPAATASLAIGRVIAEMAAESMDLMRPAQIPLRESPRR